MLFADPRGPIRRRSVMSYGIDAPRSPRPSVADRPRLHAFEFIPVLKDAVDFEAVLNMPACRGAFGIQLADAAARFGYLGAPVEPTACGQGDEPSGHVSPRSGQAVLGSAGLKGVAGISKMRGELFNRMRFCGMDRMRLDQIKALR